MRRGSIVPTGNNDRRLRGVTYCSRLHVRSIRDMIKSKGKKPSQLFENGPGAFGVSYRVRYQMVIREDDNPHIL